MVRSVTTSNNVLSSDSLLEKLKLSSQAWSKFGWNEKIDQLDEVGAAAREQKELSLAARKQLGETTKLFKKCVKSMEQASSNMKKKTNNETVNLALRSMEVLSKECRHTIKAYQEEIDNLTRRCKASETAFSSIHLALSDVSDPSSLHGSLIEHLNNQETQITKLRQTVDDVNKELTDVEAKVKTEKATSIPSSVSRAEKEELLQLRRDVAEYEIEFRGLKNQDITIRKLETKIAELEQGAQESLSKELEKAQAELAETEGRRAAEALEREAAMERRVETLELQLKAERAGREATQAHLLEADEGAGEREAAWEAQRQILVDDSERLRESLQEAIRDRDELRLRVAALEGDGKEVAPSSGDIAISEIMLERKAYEAEVRELSHTVNTLREELHLREESSKEEHRSLQTSISNLNNERKTLLAKISSIESELESAPSLKYVESIKRELRILKRLEYNAEETERDPEMTGGDELEQDFETVLVSKLKRVESELVKERNDKLESLQEIDHLKNQLTETENAKVKAENIVVSLEEDLERALNAASPTPSNKKNPTQLKESDDNPAVLQQILEPASSLYSTGTARQNPISTDSTSANEKVNDDHSVATIVMAQRDRLRARCDALEAERDSFKRELQAQVQASESLKTDNTKLYEKVRYLQSYQTRLGNQDRDLDLEALEQRYEASVDPFRQFSRAERQRKMKEMSPMERIVFVVAKTVLGTKEMRTGLFFYVCTLHVLVFFTLYHGSSSECDASQHHHMLSHLPPDQHEKIAAAVAGGAVP